MLIRFSVENFLSFKDEIELSMVAGKQRSHPEHWISDEGHGMKILKSAVIYGANASGKSNLIKAMAFAKNLIITGVRPRHNISFTPFKLDERCFTQPARFQFEFIRGLKAYIYGFTLTSEQIHEEWLYEIKATTEKVLFERKTDDKGETNVEFSNIKYKKKKDPEFLEFTARGTRPNQLFLTECIERDINYFEDVFNWFDKNLVIISPNTRADGVEATFMFNENFRKDFQEFFKDFDTGISGISLQEVKIEDESKIPENILSQIKEDCLALEIGNALQVQAPNGRYLLHKVSSHELKCYKFVTLHQGTAGDVQFETSEESDGTRRLFDLIPALMELLNDEKVFIVDELDRSLHPHLSRKILEVFLSSKSENSSQLIVTTHESSLLDLDLLRRDEIWFIEKDKNGASQVYSLEEFAPRADKDIRKGYLLGRFGAIPMIQNASIREWAK